MPEAVDLSRLPPPVQQAVVHLLETLLASWPSIPGAAPASANPFGAVAKPSGAMRRRIVALLRAQPDGLTAAQVQRALAVDKDLLWTLEGMAKDCILLRVEPGRYALAAATPVRRRRTPEDHETL